MHPDQEPVEPNKPKWLSYEELATYLLNRMAKEFGLESVQGKQKIQGKRSGTSWVIDAKGIIEGGGGFFIVECRRYTTSKQNQEKVGGLAYRILDTGANGAILVNAPMTSGPRTFISAIVSKRILSDKTKRNFQITSLRTDGASVSDS